jgi:hypothetical protein
MQLVAAVKPKQVQKRFVLTKKTFLNLKKKIKNRRRRSMNRWLATKNILDAIKEKVKVRYFFP